MAQQLNSQILILEIGTLNSHKNLYVIVHIRFICNCPKLETNPNVQRVNG